MRKIQRQSKFSVSQPPTRGPITGPSVTPNPKVANAWGCRDGRLMFIIVAWPSGASAAPPMPCRARKTTICGRFAARPHSADAVMNSTTEPRNRRRTPSRSASQPLAGIIMAAATI